MQISKTSGIDQEMDNGKACDSCFEKQPFWLNASWPSAEMCIYWSEKLTPIECETGDSYSSVGEWTQIFISDYLLVPENLLHDYSKTLVIIPGFQAMEVIAPLKILSILFFHIDSF